MSLRPSALFLSLPPPFLFLSRSTKVFFLTRLSFCGGFFPPRARGFRAFLSVFCFRAFRGFPALLLSRGFPVSPAALCFLCFRAFRGPPRRFCLLLPPPRRAKFVVFSVFHNSSVFSLKNSRFAFCEICFSSASFFSSRRTAKFSSTRTTFFGSLGKLPRKGSGVR